MPTCSLPTVNPFDRGGVNTDEDLTLARVRTKRGFTMSLFISDLAFSEGALVDTAKLGILAASLISGLVELDAAQARDLPQTRMRCNGRCALASQTLDRQAHPLPLGVACPCATVVTCARTSSFKHE